MQKRRLRNSQEYMEEQILIERLSYGNAGIAHLKSGKTIFVDRVAPGDLVLVRIEKEKARFCIGSVLKIIEPSPFRVSPPCPYFEKCGGCPWQHVDYKAQLSAKRDNVVSALTRIAKLDVQAAEQLVAPTKASKREFEYRNKLELNAGFFEELCNAPTTAAASSFKKFDIGFSKEGSHTLVNIDTCLAAHKAIAQTPKSLRGALRYLQGNQDLEIFRVGIRHSARTKDTEIALWTNPGAFPRKAVAQTLKSALKTSSIVRVIADQGSSRAVKQVEVLDGKGYWEEKMHENHFKTSAPSFFQINTTQAETLVDEVLEGLQVDSSSVVADLYAGGGTFSIALAKKAALVYAVESASSSVKDLRRNAEINEVDIEVIGGDSARELIHLGSLDALVVDPPRAGLAPGVVESIVAAKPSQVAYVSCDPSTWARDVAQFYKLGYKLSSVKPVDFFPQTYHVEIVSVLSKLEKSKYIPVSIDLGDRDLTKAESKATYGEIKQYVLDNNGLKVSQLYVAQVKRKHGLVERENYNVGSGKSKVPQVPPKKEKAIEDALRHFKMID